MSLGTVVERVADQLRNSLAAPPARIGGAVPLAASEVPAIVLSLDQVSEVSAGIGNVPRPSRREPLEIITVIDLANPVVRVGDEDVLLVSDGGQVVQIPHGPLVHADGAPVPPPLTASDVGARLDATELTLVAGPPGPGEFSLDPAAAAALGYAEPATAGVLRFGTPLTTGSLRLRYVIGEYEVSTTRHRGELRVDVYETTPAAVDVLSAAVGASLQPRAAASLGRVYALAPVRWGVIEPPLANLGTTRSRSITFRFDLELETRVIPAAGGVIRRVQATLAAPLDEQFQVPNP
jgi:hypothetical protein